MCKFKAVKSTMQYVAIEFVRTVFITMILLFIIAIGGVLFTAMGYLITLTGYYPTIYATSELDYYTTIGMFIFGVVVVSAGFTVFSFKIKEYYDKVKQEDCKDVK